MLSKKAKEKLKQYKDYSNCKCDYCIDADEKDGYLFVQRANLSKNPSRLLDDLVGAKIKL